MDGYYAFMLVATAFVLVMTVPALALFYGGMTRSKSVLNMMMLSFVAFGITTLVFVLWGWSEGWGGDGVGNGNGDLIANPFHMFGLHGVGWGSYVFVVKPDDTVEVRPVVLGPLDDGLRVIREGLKADDRVIVNGIQRARVGAKVAPQAAAAPAGGKPGDKS